MRQIYFSKYDIALFIDQKGKTRWSHLLKEFVENGSEKHISKQRLTNYLKELVDEGLVNKTVDPTAIMLKQLWRVYPVYTIPKNRKKRLEEIRNKKQILEYLDSADPEEIKRLQKHIKD
jgi:predicted house-cleaning noncanonical NTP pyrophosphatase (MazG superfamily)